MNKHNIELPPLPSPLGIVDPEGTEGMVQYTVSDLANYAKAYAMDAIAPHKQRIAEMEAELEAIGAGGVSGQRITGGRQRRGEPVAWIQRSYLNLIRESNVALHNVVVRGSILDGDGDVVPLFTAPQPAEPCESSVSNKTACRSENGDREPQSFESVELDRYDAGYLGGQDGLPAYVWHDIIRAELDRAYDFYMDQLDRAAPQPAEPVSICDCERGHNGMGMAGRECDCPAEPPCNRKIGKMCLSR